MRGLILAAGRGSRLEKFTGDRPKCFVELQGRRLVDWQLEALRGAGITEIAIATGYRAESFDGIDVTKIHNARWAETNMVATLACTQEWLSKEPCIISYSDIVYRADTVKNLMSEPADIAMTYDTEWLAQWSLRYENPLDDAETFKLDEKGAIREIGKKPQSLSDVEGQYMGLLKFTPKGWGTIASFLATQKVDKLDMTTLLNGLLSRGDQVKGVPVAGGWFEVDSPKDLEVAIKGWK